MDSLRTQHSTKQRQRGVVFMVMMVILILGSASFLVSSMHSAALQIERDKITAAALAKAKEALIGYAASNSVPGRLPCPEDTALIGTPYEGQALGSCSNTLTVIGRLPWRTLGLGDIRDANGDRLWYARSPGFGSSPVNGSDTPAQLTIDEIPNAAVAVIFSAGPPINGQSRPAPPTPPSLTQYLDLSNNDGNNTFITNGPATTFNDKLLVVSHGDLFRVVEKRVAGEVKQCLNDYAANGVGLYPWATPVTDLITYADKSNTLFGRIPDTPFDKTPQDNPSMNDQWGAGCNISGSGWWQNWKELVFYGLSDKYSPNPNAGATLLTVSPPSAMADKKFVVIVAGKTLPGQDRSTSTKKKDLANYLEPPNPITTAPSPTFFSQNAPTSAFDDTVVFP